MSREKTLVKNTVIFAIGNLGTKFISFLLIPLYTYYLSTQDYGFFDLIITTVALLTPVITAQLDNGVYRFLLDCKEKDETKKVISSSFFAVIFSLVVFNIIFIIIFSMFRSLNFKYAILIQINVTVIMTMFSQITRGLKHNVVYSMNGIIVTFITIITNLVCLAYFRLGVISLIYANIASNIISILYLNYKINIFSYIKVKSINKAIRSRIFKYSLPLIPNTISWWVMSVSDRYLINMFLGSSANGLYAVANKLPSIIMIFNFIFYLAWQESAVTEYKSEDKDKFYTNMFKNYLRIQLAAMVVLLAFTALIMKILVNKNFYEAYQYIPFLYMGSIFYGFSSFYGVIYDGSKNTIGTSITAIVGALINVIFNIIMLPKWGIQAASFATMISFFIMWLLRVIDTRKYVRIKIDLFAFIVLLFINSIYMIIYYKNITVLTALAMIGSLIIMYIFNKEFILKILSSVKGKFNVN